MYGLLGKDKNWLRYNNENLESEGGKKNQNIEKIILKVVQMKFLSNGYY